MVIDADFSDWGESSTSERDGAREVGSIDELIRIVCAQGVEPPPAAAGAAVPEKAPRPLGSLGRLHLGQPQDHVP
jgi:hypothetical protein